MTTTAATRKLEKAGFKVEDLEFGFHASSESTPWVIEFHRNGRTENITCINVRRANDHHNSMTDYSAGTFCDNITQAIRLAIR